MRTRSRTRRRTRRRRRSRSECDRSTSPIRRCVSLLARTRMWMHVECTVGASHCRPALAAASASVSPTAAVRFGLPCGLRTLRHAHLLANLQHPSLAEVLALRGSAGACLIATDPGLLTVREVAGLLPTADALGLLPRHGHAGGVEAAEVGVSCRPALLTLRAIWRRRVVIRSSHCEQNDDAARGDKSTSISRLSLLALPTDADRSPMRLRGRSAQRTAASLGGRDRRRCAPVCTFRARASEPQEASAFALGVVCTV